VGGPGVNKCSTDTFGSGPIYPTPVCIMPSSCNPGTDGNLHFCDGPDAPSSPGICLTTGTAGQGICLPQCTFSSTGGAQTGCIGKDACSVAGFSQDTSGTVIGLGYCFGGCISDSDCPTPSHCQTNEGICLTTVTTPTSPVGAACNSTTSPQPCDCISNSTTNLGFCSQFCRVGGLPSCPSGWVCDAQLPTAFAGANDASIAGWTQQNAGLAGFCAPACVVEGGASFDGGVCPTNSSCLAGDVAGPDCLP
jgi:hypothetical protein